MWLANRDRRITIPGSDGGFLKWIVSPTECAYLMAASNRSILPILWSIACKKRILFLSRKVRFCIESNKRNGVSISASNLRPNPSIPVKMKIDIQ